jgi:hypothetical protein
LTPFTPPSSASKNKKNRRADSDFWDLCAQLIVEQAFLVSLFTECEIKKIVFLVIQKKHQPRMIFYFNFINFFLGLSILKIFSN